MSGLASYDQRVHQNVQHYDRLGNATVPAHLDRKNFDRIGQHCLTVCRKFYDRFEAANTLKGYSRLKLQMWKTGEGEEAGTKLDAARADLAASLNIKKELLSKFGEANSLRSRGDLRLRLGDLEGAHSDLESALQLDKKASDRCGQAKTLEIIAKLKVQLGYLDGAKSVLEAVQLIYREVQDRQGEANTLFALGVLEQHHLGQNDQALEDYELATSIYREIHDRMGEANALQARGKLKLQLGYAEGALGDLEACRAIYRDIKNRIGLLNTLELLVDVRLNLLGDVDGAVADLSSALDVEEELSSGKAPDASLNNADADPPMTLEEELAKRRADAAGTTC
jgi:tetratricopeptide (TPR) repeat protein